MYCYEHKERLALIAILCTYQHAYHLGKICRTRSQGSGLQGSNSSEYKAMSAWHGGRRSTQNIFVMSYDESISRVMLIHSMVRSLMFIISNSACIPLRKLIPEEETISLPAFITADISIFIELQVIFQPATGIDGHTSDPP